MPGYADKPMVGPARAALLACAAACALALATPCSACAYEFWYRVYDADSNLLYDSEDRESAATGIDANTLAEGLVLEAYYNGREDPLPSTTFFAPSIGVYDEDGESLVASTDCTIDLDRSDCLETDEYGNTAYQFDEDGYFCGIAYTWTEVELSAVSPGAQITIVIAMYPYISGSGVTGAGGGVAVYEEQTVTLGVEESADEETETVGEDDGEENVAQATDGDEADEGDDAQTAEEKAESAGGTAAVGDVDAVEDDAGDDEEDTAAETGLDADAAEEDEADEADAQEAADADDGQAAAADASDSLGTVYVLAQDELEVTGLPWRYALLALLLALAVPGGMLAGALQDRRGVVAASRLIDA